MNILIHNASPSIRLQFTHWCRHCCKFARYVPEKDNMRLIINHKCGDKWIECNLFSGGCSLPDCNFDCQIAIDVTISYKCHSMDMPIAFIDVKEKLLKLQLCQEEYTFNALFRRCFNADSCSTTIVKYLQSLYNKLPPYKNENNSHDDDMKITRKEQSLSSTVSFNDNKETQDDNDNDDNNDDNDDNNDQYISYRLSLIEKRLYIEYDSHLVNITSKTENESQHFHGLIYHQYKQKIKHNYKWYCLRYLMTYEQKDSFCNDMCNALSNIWIDESKLAMHSLHEYLQVKNLSELYTQKEIKFEHRLFYYLIDIFVQYKQQGKNHAGKMLPQLQQWGDEYPTEMIHEHLWNMMIQLLLLFAPIMRDLSDDIIDGWFAKLCQVPTET